jgi:hypothetical protein
LLANDNPLILVSGEDGLNLIDELGHQPAITLHQSEELGDKKYVVLSRPLLPHESLKDIVYGKYGSLSGFDLGDPSVLCEQ